MTKSFLCSLCCEGGLLGGAIAVSDAALTYKTQKLTVSERLRKIEMPLEQIESVVAARVLGILPAVEILMKNGESLTVIVFDRKRFFEEYEKRARQYLKQR